MKTCFTVLFALILAISVISPAVCEAAGAELSFSSFDGGGPEFSVILEDESLVSYTSARSYADEFPPPGASYRETFVFTGLKPGTCELTVRSSSPIAGEHEFLYTLSVDGELNVSITAQRRLTRFWYTHGGYNAPQSYEIYLLEDSYYLIRGRVPAQKLDDATVQKIEALISEYGLESWDGFDESNEYVLDGEDFSLNIRFGDGTQITASGNNAFPPDYFEAMGSIEEILNGDEKELPLPFGTYKYEGEGFGGDFTITLRADGTYSFYEGMLSSYIGGGHYSFEDGLLVFSEEAGFELLNRFLYTGDALLFCAEDSDNFIYVKLPDGSRFVRQPDEDYDAEAEALRPVPVLAIEVNGKRFYAEPEPNSSAEVLVEKLSEGGLTLLMSDYGGFEKVGDLPWELPRNDEKITTRPGDIILYQGRHITLYYAENTWTFTRIARIDGISSEALKSLLGEGDVEIKFWVEWSE